MGSSPTGIGRPWVVPVVSILAAIATLCAVFLFGDLPHSGTDTAAGSPTATSSEPSPSVPPPSSGTPTPSDAVPTAWPTRLRAGPWPTSHVQGIAIDQERGYLYYSFTQLFVKTDLDGTVIGTVSGFTGHLGDLDFNPTDGRVYASLEYKDVRAFYIAIFNVDKIDEVGMRAEDQGIVTTVYLPEVVDDFTADLDRNGRFAGDTPNTRDHRYGCSGIDGLAFGPEFGRVDGRQYLTVAYGVYQNNRRRDNDHQVLLQYDTTDWKKYERRLQQRRPHRAGPATVAGKYFVYTGNTLFGVQSLEYDPWLERWFLATYPGTKPAFPNYTLFAVDATSQPVRQTLRGLGKERGQVLPLAADGLTDPATGIRGWKQRGEFGLQSLGDGNYYLVASASTSRQSRATVTLHGWNGASAKPFVRVER